VIYRGPDQYLVDLGIQYAEANGIAFVRDGDQGYRIIWEGHRSLRKAQEALGKLVDKGAE
jgi:hypothetical protein